MVNANNKAAYTEKFKRHVAQLGYDQAVKHHVGAVENYYKVGRLERRLLEMQGLASGSYLIDLGCGGGRFAEALHGSHDIRFLGIDIVPELIDHCCQRFPGFRFAVADNFTIPEQDASADFVTAFSLFTHLLHEESFSYVREAYRVLKPDGALILSFLEYRNAAHQRIFLSSTANRTADRPLIVFNDRENIEFFATEAGFRTTEYIDGTAPAITLEEPVALPDGKAMGVGHYAFGQSVCIMRK